MTIASLTPSQSALFLDGRWLAGDGAEPIVVRNPATDEDLATCPSASPAQVTAAIDAAHRAFPAWAARPAKERAAVLLRAAQLMMERQEELARGLTLEQGKPLAEARGEIAYAADFFTWSGEEAKRAYGETIPGTSPGKRILVLRQPVGVVAAITPWNFPAAMIARKIAPALAAGCTVVCKPAEQTPLTAIALFRILEAAGLPAGAANLVVGPPEEIGRAFLADPRVRKLAFTGSTGVGKVLMRGAADQVKKLTLELGGHAPFIVFEDADLDRAVDGAMYAKFRNAGQTCICANRIYVHAALQDAFTARFVDKVRALTMGGGLEAGSQIGPLINEEGFRKVSAHVEDAVRKGARVLCGGKTRRDGPFARGWWFEPTVLDRVTPDMRILHEETFGPVAPILAFASEDEAVRMANNTPYGLAAYFYTKDLSRAVRVMERLDYGMIGVNDPAISSAQVPFGGMKESGIGREGGKYGLEEFLEIKYVNIGV